MRRRHWDFITADSQKELSISEHNQLRHNTTKNTASSQANVRKLKHNHICDWCDTINSDGWLAPEQFKLWQLDDACKQNKSMCQWIMGWVQVNVYHNRVESLSYLSEISNVKQIESLKQLALLHDEYLWAGVQKCPDVLQAEKLNRNKRHISY